MTDGTTQKVVDYLDGFQYAGSVLQFFPHPEGYVKATAATPTNTSYYYDYVYNYTDHLGNVRLSYSKDPATNELKIMDETHYYPFGLKHEVYIPALKQNFVLDQNTSREALTNVTETDYQYKFNGKEWQDELGLNFYDYGARNYDPTIGRWMNMDPLAEVSRRWSPYTYVYNNPLRFIDPDGMAADDVIIKGDLAEKAVEQLNESSSLTITRDAESGKLSAEGKAKTKADKALLKAINDKDITVNLNATKSNQTKLSGETKDLYIGAYGGSKINEDGSVTAFTDVNPNQAEIAGEHYETTAGSYVTHEILESYNAAKSSPGSGPVSFSDIKNKTPNAKVYEKAHNKALRQDRSFVQPTIIGDNSSGTGIYYLRKMKTVPGVDIPLEFDVELYKKIE